MDDGYLLFTSAFYTSVYAVLSMTSLSQSEINGADTEPFRVDLDALLNREEKAVPADTKDIFERIYRGSMPYASNTLEPSFSIQS